MANDNGIEIQSSNTRNPEATETTPLVNRNDSEGQQESPRRGISLKEAACIIAGELAGGGVLVLPKALTKTGWVGVPLLILTCLMAGFSGKRLSDCWTLLEARNPDLRTLKRNPYAIIAEQTLGRAGSAAVSLGLVVTQFGAAVVQLLLAAQLLESLLLALLPTLSICLWYLIVAGVATPLLLFGMPKDYSFVGVIACASAVVACVLYFVELMCEIRPFVFRYGAHGFSDFFLAVGMMMFAFGGAASIPTLQNDMTDRTQFTKSLQYSILATLALYLSLAVAGYSVLGEAVGYNLATSLSATPLTLVANVFMAVHLLTAFLMGVNPLCQEMEHLYNSPRDSVGHRTLVSLSVMLAIVFVGESVPRFYTILALVGGSTVALLTFVLPSYCYLALSGAGSEGAAPPGWVRIVCWEVIVAGALAGAFATFSALAAIFGPARAVPCYLR